MAKKQFKFTKDVTNTNLANQIKSYNTALYDRARSRAVQEGQTDAERDAYINNNSLSRNPKNPAGARDASYVSNYYGASSPVAGSYAAAAAGGGIGAPHPTMTGTSSAAGVGGFSALASRAAAERSRTSNKDDEPATSA
jgi:hypothetical protein